VTTSPHEHIGRENKVRHLLERLSAVGMDDADLLESMDEEFWWLLAQAASVHLPSAVTRRVVIERLRERSAA
jgi:hypothetical protein